MNICFIYIGRMENEKVKFLIEVPVQVAANLRKEAQLENRSRNAQINQILKERYSDFVNHEQSERIAHQPEAVAA